MAFTPTPTNGPDTITGAAASGPLDALLGDDFVEATIVGSTTVRGNGGHDDIEIEGDFSILIYGNADADTVNVTTDATATIFGGSGVADPTDGDDSVSASGTGAFLIYGNGGDDALILSLADEGSDSIYGGAGNDRIRYSRDGNEDSEVLIFGGEQQDVIRVTTAGSATLFGGVTTVDPADGNDTIIVTGDNGDNELLIYGNGGEDLISADVGGNVTIFAGSGDDTVYATTDGSILAYGGSGDDTISVSGVGDVTLVGGVSLFDPDDGEDSLNVTTDGDALVYASGGNDTVSAWAAGNITVYGGQGDDSIGEASADGDILVYGGEDDDTVLASGNSDITVYGGVGASDPGDGNDSISASADGAVLIYANGGEDTVNASGVGNVTVFGNEGNDSIEAAGGADGLIYGGAGNDSIDSGNTEGNPLGSPRENFSGNVTIYGGVGPVDASDGDDYIEVEFSGNGLIYGNAGNDTIDVKPDGLGSDASVYAGTGNDRVFLEDDSGGDYLIVAGLGNDTVDYTGTGSVTVYGGDAVFNPNDDADVIYLGNVGPLDPGVVSALVYGNGGGDEIDVALDNLNGSATLYGGAGDDVVEVYYATKAPGFGTAALVYGGEGFDTVEVSIDGGVTIFGGTGTFDPNDGEDHIEVTGSGAYLVYGNGDDDTISIDGDTSGTVGSTSTVYGGAGDDAITVDNNFDTIDRSDGPVLVYGGENQDDILVDTTGDATIYGGTGPVDANDGGDTIHFLSNDAASGDDFLIYGNAGDDLILGDVNPGDFATIIPGPGDDTVDVTDGAIRIVYLDENDSTFIAGPDTGFDVIRQFSLVVDDVIDIAAVVIGTPDFSGLTEAAPSGAPADLGDAVAAIAAEDSGNGTDTFLRSFSFVGNTYLFIDNSAAGTFQPGVDLLLRFDGAIDLEEPDFAV